MGQDALRLQPPAVDQQQPCDLQTREVQRRVPPENQTSGIDEDPEVSEAKITPLSDRILNKYLSTRAD